jgi:hypothetical protein
MNSWRRSVPSTVGPGPAAAPPGACTPNPFAPLLGRHPMGWAGREACSRSAPSCPCCCGRWETFPYTVKAGPAATRRSPGNRPHPPHRNESTPHRRLRLTLALVEGVAHVRQPHTRRGRCATSAVHRRRSLRATLPPRTMLHLRDARRQPRPSPRPGVGRRPCRRLPRQIEHPARPHPGRTSHPPRAGTTATGK